MTKNEKDKWAVVPGHWWDRFLFAKMPGGGWYWTRRARFVYRRRLARGE